MFKIHTKQAYASFLPNLHVNKSTSVNLFSQSLMWSFLLAISAQISVPFYPVPMTMQSAVVLLIGLQASPVVAFSALFFYLIEALIGLPVLQGFKGGIAVFTSPTAGYLVGYLVSVFLITALKPMFKNRLWMLCFFGLFVLYAFGLFWLTILFDFNHAVIYGLNPFILKIPADIAFSIFFNQVIERYKIIKRHS